MNQPPLDAYKNWTPGAQQKALETLRAMQNQKWRPFYCPNPTCDGTPHDTWEWNHARKDQRPPTGDDWLVWLLLGGRGAGKTRTGTAWVHQMTEHTPRVALIGPTGADVRDTLLEGESGILTLAPPGRRPIYEPSKRRLTWPNGCVATTFSAEEPDRLRGPEHGAAWLDEACFYSLLQDVWDNLLFGLRLGRTPRICVTTTPKPRPWLRELVAQATTRMQRASTYDNLDNLSPVFRERVIAKYEGTRLGRQELLAEILEDVEGALWHWDLIETGRVVNAPDMRRIVVGVDPAGSRNRASDETGIVVVGRGVDDEYYVLDDRSGKYSPHGWATAVNNAVEDHEADAIVAERNYGGDMVENTLRTSGFTGARILMRTATRGKALRAEPVVGLYEKGLVHHVGAHPTLEQQMTEWQPYEDKNSPDRVDALVYGLTEVAGRAAQISMATPAGRQLRLIPGGAA